jgi:hypothetical protein
LFFNHALFQYFELQALSCSRAKKPSDANKNKVSCNREAWGCLSILLVIKRAANVNNHETNKPVNISHAKVHRPFFPLQIFTFSINAFRQHALSNVSMAEKFFEKLQTMQLLLAAVAVVVDRVSSSL